MTGNPKSSPWSSTPRAKRHRKPLTITLSNTARVRLELLAERTGDSLSAAVERLILGGGS